jgi:hypothetical protein
VTQETEEGVVIDPCTPRGYRWSVEEGQHHAVSISTGTHSPVSSILSQGNFSECRSAAYSLLQKDRDACTYPKCAIGSAFVPELRGNFFATGNCYYTSEVSPFALFLFTSFMSYRQVVLDTAFYFDIVAAQFILQTEQIEYTDKILRQLIHS